MKNIIKYVVRVCSRADPQDAEFCDWLNQEVQFYRNLAKRGNGNIMYHTYQPAKKKDIEVMAS